MKPTSDRLEIMDEISARLEQHYDMTFRTRGATSDGVDWGPDETKLERRYALMLEVAARTAKTDWSILDVGCGFGGLLEFLRRRGVNPAYTGVEISQSMIDWAQANIAGARFIQGDFLQWETEETFDFVICNGILTQKLDTPALEMDAYASNLIKKMFRQCNVGIAFNIMTTKSNFYSNNLYYRNPGEVMSWCLSEITPYVKIDHTYPYYEFTTYLYKNPE